MAANTESGGWVLTYTLQSVMVRVSVNLESIPGTLGVRVGKHIHRYRGNLESLICLQTCFSEV